MATPLAQASNSSNANFTRQPPSTKSDVVDISALQSASRVLLEQLAKDAQIIPDIGETLTTRMSYVCLDSDNPNGGLQLVTRPLRLTACFQMIFEFLFKREDSWAYQRVYFSIMTVSIHPQYFYASCTDA